MDNLAAMPTYVSRCAAPARKSCWPPKAAPRHEGHSEESALRKADRKQGAVAWIGKYGGFWSGLRAQIAAIFGALGSLQLGVLKYLLASQKVDGSQQE